MVNGGVAVAEGTTGRRHTAGGADGDLGVEYVFAGRLETVDKNRNWTYHIMEANQSIVESGIERASKALESDKTISGNTLTHAYIYYPV
jgi:hypothetical protein